MNEKEQALTELSRKKDTFYESVGKKDNGSIDANSLTIDFSTFIFSMSTAAQIQLGDIAKPETGKNETDLPMAKQTIDILTMLQEKTKGNLIDEESKLLDNILDSLRSGYIDRI